MKKKARSRGKIDNKPARGKKHKAPWFTPLKPKDIVDNLPIMTHSKDQRERIQLPIHPSSGIIATRIREAFPEKFRIDLDVHKTMHYIGRQLLEHVFLNNPAIVRGSKRYKLAMIMDTVDSINYDRNWMETYLNKLLEGYLSQGEGEYSKESIIEKVNKIKALLHEDLHPRCDNFIDDDLDSPVVQHRIKERLRKREYRNRKNKISLVR